jgi:hypothetical protein
MKMAKYGVSLKIDVSKIDKARLFKGEKGVYLDATVFINVDEQGQYGDNGMVTQSWKDQQKGEGPILGNAKVFWRDDGQQAQQAPKQQSQPQPTTGGPGPENDFDSDVPFAPLQCLLA